MISVNLRDASTHTHAHMARSWLEFWKTMSRAERSRNLFSRKFFFEFVLSCLLLILLLFSREEEKGRRKKGGWGYTFESLSIMRIFLMWNCLIVLKRKDSLGIFVVKFFEIFSYHFGYCVQRWKVIVEYQCVSEITSGYTRNSKF